jgi:hypothetical protein
MGAPGFVTTPQKQAKTSMPQAGGANSGTLPPDPVDPDLAKIIAAWPKLSPAKRAALVAAVLSILESRE